MRLLRGREPWLTTSSKLSFCHPPGEQFLIKKIPAMLRGITRVPMRGRGSSIPFAVNVLTASRTRTDYAELLPQLHFAGKNAFRLIFTSQYFWASFSASTYEMFFCAASCCALKDINLPFSFLYSNSMPPGAPFRRLKTAKRRFLATLKRGIVEKSDGQKIF